MAWPIVASSTSGLLPTSATAVRKPIADRHGSAGADRVVALCDLAAQGDWERSRGALALALAIALAI